MKFLRSIAWVLVLVSLASRAGAQATSADPEQIQIDAYTAIVHGDQARDRSDWRNAVRSYRDAETFYKRLAADHPQWHPEIVQYRLTYCGNEIAGIVTRSGRSEAEILSAPAPGPGAGAATNDASTRVDELSSENDGLRAEIERLNKEIQSRPSSESWEAEIRRLKEENTGLQGRLAAMSNEVAKIPPANQNAISTLSASNAQLNAELEKARKHSAALRETVDLQQIELKKIDDLRNRADALKAEKDRLYAEMKKAKDELDRALQEKRVMKLEALVANLRAEIKAAREEEDQLRERISSLEKENAGLKKK